MPSELELIVAGNRLQSRVDGQTVLEARDDTLADGGIGLLIEEGRTATQRVAVAPPNPAAA